MDESDACSLKSVPEDVDFDLTPLPRSGEQGPLGAVSMTQQRMLAGPWRAAAEEGMGLPDTPFPAGPFSPWRTLAEEDAQYARALQDPRMIRAYGLV